MLIPCSARKRLPKQSTSLPGQAADPETRQNADKGAVLIMLIHLPDLKRGARRICAFRQTPGLSVAELQFSKK